MNVRELGCGEEMSKKLGQATVKEIQFKLRPREMERTMGGNNHYKIDDTTQININEYKLVGANLSIEQLLSVVIASSTSRKEILSH